MDGHYCVPCNPCKYFYFWSLWSNEQKGKLESNKVNAEHLLFEDEMKGAHAKLEKFQKRLRITIENVRVWGQTANIRKVNGDNFNRYIRNNIKSKIYTFIDHHTLEYSFTGHNKYFERFPRHEHTVQLLWICYLICSPPPVTAAANGTITEILEIYLTINYRLVWNNSKTRRNYIRILYGR